MRILAIDPGSKLGWATNQTGRLEWGTEDFHVKNGESSGNRWRRFGDWLLLATTRLYDPTGGRALYEEELKSRNLVDLVIYERAMFAPKARAAAEIAAGFTTRLEEHCEKHGIALQPVAVQTLKAFAIPAVKRKKGDPKLDRSKGAMIRGARLRLASTHNPIAIDQTEQLTEHEADALWLYWYAQDQYGVRVPGSTAAGSGDLRVAAPDASPVLSTEGT